MKNTQCRVTLPPGEEKKNNTIVSQEVCSWVIYVMYFHDMTFLQDISIILITA